MFPLPYPAPFAEILYALLALDLFLLAGGLAFGPWDAAKTGRLPRPVCMALSAILVAAALIQWRLAGEGAPAAGYARWVFLGMALGFLGDLVMARLIPVPDRLLCGMLAFGLGQVAYIVGMQGLVGALDLHHWPILAVGALAALLSVALWGRYVRKPDGPEVLNTAALVYSLLMAAMNALAISLALQNARFVPLAVGAASSSSPT